MMAFRPFAPLTCLLLLALTLLPALQPLDAQGSRSSRSRSDESKVQPALPQEAADAIQWRSIGPATMGGRITAIAVYEEDPNIWWAATASGGLLKTVNNGNDFEHQFDDQATVSIGDVQVSQSNPDIVWVGTGESNPRNSVSWGDGVYKSTDGGKTWTNMGLKKSFQTGALAIHPTNPEIVWVGALGRLWGPSEERGLFKTTDGGKTWRKVLYVDDKTGVVDVQLNPKNPDEMLVATYERKRDGFDGNDPEKRFGDGAGIYKSTDGGETFTEVTEGLPTCKMGRIGLDYFESDPNFVFAVVESEKIGKEPDKFPYLGIRGSDADAGAVITRVTDDTPAAAAGLKENDIVMSVNQRVVPGYDGMLEEVYRSQAGDTVKLTVVRDGELVELELKLTEKPENQRDRGSYFTGTLGGQGGNRQSAQGEEGYEYGGVYMSEDGGSTWKRINSLNPRPMYYSNIQVDPVDRNNIYLCGTSLYKSSDGGETFTGDGGSDGIHVDHHAMWIDKRDPKHIILGNDGGIYVTWDRMAHWDHHNHVAIGQFYHVGVDTNLNYRVFGGLQDNGSWGGPSRNDYDEIINSDWFRVGGGDGFVTRADPNDPNQIYFESQNGGMGRIHLETGARGFIRPRERGINFRFNWKTPFILSPHNSKIHYSAGNYVLRSLDKGDGVQRISPMITNTDRGAGSALTESPRTPGVIYVGTTDGSVWVTRDGGQDWNPLFYNPEKEDEKKDAETKDQEDESEEKSADDSADDKEAADKEGAPEESGSDQPSPSDAMKDSISGTWNATLQSDRIPEDRSKFKLVLKLDGDKLSGSYSGRSGDQPIADGKFNPESGEFQFAVESGRAARSFSGTVADGKINGEMSIANGRFKIEFSAVKDESGNASVSVWSPTLGMAAISAAYPGALLISPSTDDPISGTWTGVLENENLPDGRLEFSMELKLKDENKVSGTISSPQGELEIYQGVFNDSRKRLILKAENNEGLSVEVAGSLDGDKLAGKIYVTEPAFEIDFEATLTKSAAPEKPADKADKGEKADQPQEQAESDRPASRGDRGQRGNRPRGGDRPRQDAETGDRPTQEPEAGDRPRRGMQGEGRRRPGRGAGEARTGEGRGRSGEPQESESESEVGKTSAADDPITGTWTGKMVSERGDRDLTVILKRKSNDSISGTLDTGQGEQEITSGKFDPQSGMLTLVAESDRFTLEASGKVEGESFVGKLDFASGRFVMDVQMKRTSREAKVPEAKVDEPAEAKVAPTGEGSLASLMPGPRWVSSLEASRFSDGRCYITFDGHRSDDDASYAFVTEDYGQTWKSLTKNLPAGAGSIRVLREDLENENLLYLGCEFSGWWSIDRGQTWTKIGGLPTVAIHEFAIHPEAGEVVAGTHGRSLWIADVSVLRQVTAERLKEPLYLYDVKTVYRRRSEPSRGDSGTRRFQGENPDSGVNLGYSLGRNARSISLKVFDINGEEVYEFEDLPREQGMHLLSWNLRKSGGGRRSSSISTGQYRVELRVDGQIRTTVLDIELDPELPTAVRATMEASDQLTELENWLGEMIED